MIESLDREARRLGVTRQSIIKVWIAERLEHRDPTAEHLRRSADAVQRVVGHALPLIPVPGSEVVGYPPVAPTWS